MGSYALPADVWMYTGLGIVTVSRLHSPYMKENRIFWTLNCLNIPRIHWTMATKQSFMDTTDYAMTPVMTPASSTTNDPTLPRRPLPERPLPGGLSTSCQPQPSTLQYADFPTEPPEGVHLMLWGMLKPIKNDVAQLQGVGDRLTALEDQVDKDGSDIAMIQLFVQQLISANKTLAGRLMRVEATIEKQQATITDLKMRSMRDNIIIKTTGPKYKDIQDENTDSTIRRFLKDEMHIANVEDIRMNSSHRMGQASANFNNKMLIARLPCRTDQSKIFDNASALQGTNFSICKQFPPRKRKEGSSLGPTTKERKRRNELPGLMVAVLSSAGNASRNTIPCLSLPPAIHFWEDSARMYLVGLVRCALKMVTHFRRGPSQSTASTRSEKDSISCCKFQRLQGLPTSHTPFVYLAPTVHMKTLIQMAISVQVSLWCAS